MAYHRISSSESTLVQQLDDTIARIVASDTDVFYHLFTANENWHLASNLGLTSAEAPLPPTCELDEDCILFHCDGALGVCVVTATGATEGDCNDNVCPGETEC